ncbi:MAG: aspartate carbamoyltransferase catalytic subunit [Nannocystis sp.]|nr:aspartate carbamoyltransferase catalytic subunit [Nannocystis sp.]
MTRAGAEVESDENGLHRRAGRDLCGIGGVPVDSLREVLEMAAALASARHDTLTEVLRGRTVLCFFGEPSTRTRLSFEVAARRLGAEVMGFGNDQTTSAAKGETPLDAARNLDAMGVDAFVVRDRHEGWSQVLCHYLRARVINAGDGCGEHPTQALADALTILEAFGRRPEMGANALAGLRVALCGDIRRGRVAHSNLLLLPRLGAEVVVAGPTGMIDAAALPEGVALAGSLEEALAGSQVVMMLRIQRERASGGLEASDDAYHAGWGLSAARLAAADPRAIVMHPGPLNRGVEIADEVADGPRSRILRQVTLGVAVRMVVLARACGRMDALREVL